MPRLIEWWLVLQSDAVPDLELQVDNAVSVAADFALPLKCAARGRFIASAGCGTLGLGLGLGLILTASRELLGLVTPHAPCKMLHLPCP